MPQILVIRPSIYILLALPQIIDVAGIISTLASNLRKGAKYVSYLPSFITFGTLQFAYTT